jgi:hypothetical protein
MKPPLIATHKSRIDSLFAKVATIEDFEVRAHWARYLCVLVSGYIETSFRAIYNQYAKDKAAPKVASYVDIQLQQFRNPNMERILTLTRSFSAQWGDALEKVTDGQRAAAIDSIVANRHQIAHGGLFVGITFATIEKYYKNANEVIDLVSEQCDS